MICLVNHKQLLPHTYDISMHPEVLVHVNQPCGNQTEEYTKAKDHQVTNPLTERRFATEEGVLALILIKARRECKVGHGDG